MLEQIDQIIKVIDGAVWGLPLIIYRISSHNPAGSFTNKTSRESPKVYV